MPLVELVQADPGATVLVLTNMWPHPGHAGYGIFVKRQVESLREAGVRCDVLFVRGHLSVAAYPLAALRVLALNADRRRRYRLVHAHGGETAPVARCYLRAPVLTSYCGDDLLGTSLADGTLTRRSRIRAAFLRVHARSLSATITKSAEMEAALPPAARARNAVVPNGVDTAIFAPTERAQARAQLGWDSDEPVVLFAADPAIENKRHWLAATAVQRAAARLPGVRLHVAARVEPREMPLLMSAADCLVMTSATEGSPNVVKEALMCNLPVVSVDVGDVRELLAPVTPSYVCEADADRLADALVSCLDAPRRSNGRERAGWLAQESIAARILAVYDRLAPASPPRPERERPACAG